MKTERTRREYVSWLAAILALSALGRAAALRAEPADWSPELARQLQREKGCKVLYVLNVKEYRLFEQDIVEARVQCEDGRSFDAVRKGSGSAFEISYCKPTAC